MCGQQRHSLRREVLSSPEVAHEGDGCGMIPNDSDSSGCHGHLFALPQAEVKVEADNG